MSRIQANLLLLLAAAIWGGGFVAQSTAMGHMEPNWYNALRFLLASLALLPFALYETRRAATPLTRRQRLGFVVTGIALFIAQTFQQFGLKYTTVTNASFLTGLYVVMVPVIAVAALRQKPHWIIWPAALACLIGILLLSGGSLSRLNGGDGLTMICALFFAVQITMTGRLMAGTPRPMTLAFIQFAVTAVCGLITAGALEPIRLADIENGLVQILYGGLLSSGAAFTLQIVGQRYTTAPQAAIFLSSEALFGALLGALLLGESLPFIGYMGCGLLFLAMLSVEIVPEWSRFRMASS
ncbi:DMT family transporter [Rhizobium paknamense]|uniref:Drug/metabolite transporter (DMT)-like permease n=1 Tax=Rhizobium paknamense TaxID=1206817 RepID=A0ABU0I8G5_9HYPH|nr:DMT family transporter [Rhizobium paknamense]MDQ0454528.1 drug/metabolite transporter (DMT)-like permease [Rhizobium paknamense]